MPQTRRKAPRVVLDTNIVLSALVFGGDTPGAIRRAWQQRHCRPLVSKATVTELIRVLAYPKFKLDAGEQEQLLADYLPYCDTVRVPSIIEGIPACRDPFDLPFLALAIAGKADYLVTGDQDLLTLAGEAPLAIITATELRSQLPDQGPVRGS